MGKWINIIFGIALAFLAAESWSWIQFVPDGALEYLFIVVGVLMVLIPVEAPAVKRTRKARGLPGPKLFGLFPKGLIFTVFGAVVVIMGLVSAGFLGAYLGELFAGLSIYTAGGRWVMIGIAAILVLSAFSQADTPVAFSA